MEHGLGTECGRNFSTDGVGATANCAVPRREGAISCSRALDLIARNRPSALNNVPETHLVEERPWLRTTVSSELAMPNTAAQLVEIYNLLCRSALNKEYYGAVLYRTQRLNDVLEILIAVGATGSGLSAFWISSWNRMVAHGYGAQSQECCSLTAIAKPIVQLNKRIERLTRLYVGHNDNYTSLEIIVSRVADMAS